MRNKDKETLKCPVCRASFKETKECTRCGADIKPLMTVTAKAYVLRKAARDLMFLGDLDRSLEFAEKAQKLHRTDAGGKLKLLNKWLISQRA